jgi:hypothetical protein
MQEYCAELETLIIDVLLPVYLEHARLTGKKDALKNINADLLAAVKRKRKVPAILQKAHYG